MIYIVTQRDLGPRPGLFIAQHKLRHREFIARQAYAVKEIAGLEFDQYDHLASIYLIYSEDGKTALGVSRLSPVSYGCMLQDIFPEMVDDQRLFSLPGVWEATRFCVDSRLGPEKRRKIIQHLACAYIEFALEHRIDCIIGLMHTLLLKTVFERNGVVMNRLGDVREIGHHTRVQAAAIPIHKEQLRTVYQHTGLMDVLGFASSRKGRRHAA